jgi:large subunit ribosomal protein L15
MKYSQLNLTRERKARRKGRGISAGRGKTGGRGTKGQGARKSGNVRVGFEGGQMPLYIRLPHLRGFRSYKTKSEVVTTGELELVKGSMIDALTLHANGLVSSPYNMIKLVVKGEIKSKKDVKLPSASASAIKAVEAAGGKFTKTGRLARQPKTKADEAKA